MNKDKECWICRRTLSEVIEAGNKMGYDPIICENDPKEIEKNAMLTVDVLGREVAVCAICRDIVFEVARDNLLDALDNGTGDSDNDIITYKDMKNVTLEVHLGETKASVGVK